MKNLLTVLIVLFPAITFAQAESDPEPLPNLGVIEEMSYYMVSSGYISQPLPSGDSAHFGQLNLGYVLVDESVMQVFQLNFGMGGKSQILSAGYGLALGPRSGYIHGGVLINLGYAHLWDSEKEDVHGLYMAAGPMIAATFWESWQFYLAGLWSATPLTSEKIPNGRGLAGFAITVGVAASLD